MYIKTSNQKKLYLGIGDYSCNWGIHIAGLYETKSGHNETINGYLAQGLISGDRQLYCFNALNGGVLMQNPYYKAPSKWQSKNDHNFCNFNFYKRKKLIKNTVIKPYKQ